MPVKRRVIGNLVALVSALLLVNAACRPAPAAAIPWRPSYPLAFEEAREQGRPLLLYFQAGWCGICRDVEARALTNPEVVVATAAAVPVKIDIDREPRVAERFGVDAIPAWIIVPPDGAAPSRLGGRVEARDLLEFIRQAASAEDPVP